MAGRGRRILSFDLDGTLVQHDFSTAVWREAIPALLARQRGLSLEQAKDWIFQQYDSVGEDSLAWYDLGYWYNLLDLQEDWRATLRRCRSLIRLFPEVPGVISTLSRSYRMIIVSNATHPFIEAEMEETGLVGLFEEVISATSDFREVKKTEEFYQRVCKTLGVDPAELVHVGDHRVFDYLAPARAGIQAYFLDRSRKTNGPETVHDLNAFAQKVLDDYSESPPPRR